MKHTKVIFLSLTIISSLLLSSCDEEISYQQMEIDLGIEIPEKHIVDEHFVDWFGFDLFIRTILSFEEAEFNALVENIENSDKYISDSGIENSTGYNSTWSRNGNVYYFNHSEEGEWLVTASADENERKLHYEFMGF